MLVCIHYWCISTYGLWQIPTCQDTWRANGLPRKEKGALQLFNHANKSCNTGTHDAPCAAHSANATRAIDERGTARRIKRAAGALALAGALVLGMVGCTGSGATAPGGTEAKQPERPEKIVFAWEPSNSGADYEAMRDSMAAAIEDATGIPCEVMTTTDYNVTIEALSSGQAQVASLGADEYVEIHDRNPAIEAGFVLSDKQGELNPVSYYSQIICRDGEQDQFTDANGAFDFDKLRGQDYSFVSLSSTSGYVIPATVFAGKFGYDNIDVFAESGEFFNKVVMATSQPLSVYQVASGNVNLASCDNTSASAAYHVVSGINGEVGCVYEVQEGLEGDLANWAGSRLVCVNSFPVPAVPFCINTEALPADVVDAIITYMTSDEVANNPDIFVNPDNPSHKSKYKKSSDKVRFVAADDAYYNDYRKLVGKE